MVAEIKVHTFPFTKYGVIDATVKNVTADALANQENGLLFAMHLTMHNNTIFVNGKDIQLHPGMQVTAEVKTGKRRIIEYILTPLLKGFKESVRGEVMSFFEKNYYIWFSFSMLSSMCNR